MNRQKLTRDLRYSWRGKPNRMKAASAIQATIDFIEANLKEPISISDMANRAGLSFWHFQRVFALVAKDPVGSYVRKRRIQESMKELTHGKLRIIDVAFEYQFESHEVYSRAFRSLFGLPPSRHRELGNLLKYPKLLLSDSIVNFKNGSRILMIPNILKLEPIPKPILVPLKWILSLSKTCLENEY